MRRNSTCDEEEPKQVAEEEQSKRAALASQESLDAAVAASDVTADAPPPLKARFGLFVAWVSSPAARGARTPLEHSQNRFHILYVNVLAFQIADREVSHFASVFCAKARQFALREFFMFAHLFRRGFLK